MNQLIKNMEINKVLVANRGEIAVRIMRTLRQMQIASVALFTEEESDDLHVRFADEAYALGNGSLQQTWLNIALIISIAMEAGADAVHPGYGFLSENDAFARACEESGLVFIGPSSDVIKKMGSKIEASAWAKKAGIPLLPRLEGTVEELISMGSEMEFPLLVKAAAGGGGKGMIRIDNPSFLSQAVNTASGQARRYFDDDKVYLEKYVENPRHIEVQILGDHFGNVIHLHERECTLQRNHQKVVEEAPSVSLNPQNRAALHQAAVDLAKTVNYISAGTVEFILDEQGNFFFLEMNTRIQVEHPVSEIITGVDIVKEQLFIAMNKPLPFNQQDVVIKGHAIESRLYAEDPSNNFMPSAGLVKKLVLPSGKGIRVDSAIEKSGKVHSSFDAMIAKVIGFGFGRDEAIEKSKKALQGVMVHGITTNIDLLLNIMSDQEFVQNQISTHSISRNLQHWALRNQQEEACIIAAGLFLWLQRYDDTNKAAWRMVSMDKVVVNNEEMNVFHHPIGNRGIQLENNRQAYSFENIEKINDIITCSFNKRHFQVVFSNSGQNAMFLLEGIHYHVVLPESVVLPKISSNGNAMILPELKASLFGKVLKINVAEKQQVKTGEPLLVLESMKMENTVLAPANQIISSINVKEGDQVSDGQVLICFES